MIRYLGRAQQSGQNMLKRGHFAYHYLHTFCTNFVYTLYTQYLWCTLFVDQNWCIQNVSKMYTKCIPHFDKLLYTLCIQNLTAIVRIILYTKCILKFVEMWNTFCIYIPCISCIHLAQFLYIKCIHDFCLVMLFFEKHTGN